MVKFLIFGPYHGHPLPIEMTAFDGTLSQVNCSILTSNPVARRKIAIALQNAKESGQISKIQLTLPRRVV